MFRIHVLFIALLVSSLAGCQKMRGAEPCTNPETAGQLVEAGTMAAAYAPLPADIAFKSVQASWSVPEPPEFPEPAPLLNPTNWVWHGFIGRNCKLLSNGTLFNVLGDGTWVKNNLFYDQPGPPPVMARQGTGEPGQVVDSSISRFVFPEAPLATGWSEILANQGAADTASRRMLVGDYGVEAYLIEPAMVVVALEVNDRTELSLRPDLCEFFPSSKTIQFTDIAVDPAQTLEWSTWVLPVGGQPACGLTVEASGSTVTFSRP